MAARKNRKGRERAGTTDEDATGLVRVKLTDEQVRERADSLASMIKKKEEVEGKKAAAASKFNGELKLLEEKISQLADEVDTREANVEAQQAIDFGGPAGRRKRDATGATPSNDEVPSPEVTPEAPEVEPVIEGAA